MPLELPAQLEADSFAAVEIDAGALERPVELDRSCDALDRQVAGYRKRAVVVELHFRRGEDDLGVPLGVEEIGRAEVRVPLGVMGVEAGDANQPDEARLLADLDRAVEVTVSIIRCLTRNSTAEWSGSTRHCLPARTCSRLATADIPFSFREKSWRAEGSADGRRAVLFASRLSAMAGSLPDCALARRRREEEATMASRGVFVNAASTS